MVPWLLELESETPQVQVTALRYWQTWLYYKHVADSEALQPEPMSLPTPTIDLTENTELLLDLQYILARTELSSSATTIYTNYFKRNQQETPTPTPNVDSGDSL